MSISDQIVVMSAGVVQQSGKPQDVYDRPVNLFVAKFLGTPAVNVFNGEVRDGKLFIGDEAVLDVSGISSQKVWAAIRPEGFIPDESGPLTCGLIAVEVMGRDTSIVASHPALEGVQIRAIIDSDERPSEYSRNVRFSLKPHKVHLFHKETEERLN